ncbi:unnamed protein product [Closterium sp. NIES-53]
MALCPSSVPQRVPLPSPPASSLADGPNPESDLVRAASPTIPRLLATVVTDPSFDVVAEFESDCPPSVGGECALGTDVLEDRQEDFECFAATVPHLVSMLIAPEGDPDAPDILTSRSFAEKITACSPFLALLITPHFGYGVQLFFFLLNFDKMASWKSTGTYVDAFPPPGANIVDGMWIFRGVDFFETFSPTPKMTTLREIWLRRPPGFTGSFPPGTQWSLRQPVYGLRQAPREWHDTMRTTLAALGFAPSTADPSLFLRTDTSLLPLYVLVYVNDLVFATADTEALALVKSELHKRHTCTDQGPLALRLPVLLATVHSSAYQSLALSSTFGRVQHWEAAKRVLRYLCSTSGMGLVLGGRSPVVLTGHADAFWVDDLATQRSAQGYTFSLGFGSVSWRSTRSSSVLSSSCEAKIYVGAMAAQELRWLTYLLTDLGERPRSSPLPYVDNKAMIALCREHRPEHRTKHIALRYFFARELQQRGQLRLAYVATRANTADIFTKALQFGDHQRFFTVLGLLSCLAHQSSHLKFLFLTWYQSGACTALPCLHCPAWPALRATRTLPCQRPARAALLVRCLRHTCTLPVHYLLLLPARCVSCLRTACLARALPAQPTRCSRIARPTRAQPACRWRHLRATPKARLARALPAQPALPTQCAAYTHPARTAAAAKLLLLPAPHCPAVPEPRRTARAAPHRPSHAAVPSRGALPSRAALPSCLVDLFLLLHCCFGFCSPEDTAVRALRTQWLIRDVAARLSVRNALPPEERIHFGQLKMAKELYDAVVARYSSSSSAALGRIMLPYLHPELSEFQTVADLFTHLRSSDARYRATLKLDFLAANPPPMYITLYYLVNRLPDSLCAVRDHFLALDPTEITLSLLEKHLLEAEKSSVAVAASRGTPLSPFFEGCSPSLLVPSVATTAVDFLCTEEVGAMSAPSRRRRNNKGKGGKGCQSSS